MAGNSSFWSFRSKFRGANRAEKDWLLCMQVAVYETDGPSSNTTTSDGSKPQSTSDDGKIFKFGRKGKLCLKFGSTKKAKTITRNQIRMFPKFSEALGLEEFAKFKLHREDFLLCGIDGTTDTAEIMADLIEQGYSVKNVRSLSKCGKKPMNKFLVTVLREPGGKKMEDLKTLKNTPVEVESINSSPGPVMCFRCSTFGHISQMQICNTHPRCYKCAEAHQGKDCPKPKDEGFDGGFVCPNCGGNHPAFSKECPVYAEEEKRHAHQKNGQYCVELAIPMKELFPKGVRLFNPDGKSTVEPWHIIRKEMTRRINAMENIVNNPSSAANMTGQVRAPNDAIPALDKLVGFFQKLFKIKNGKKENKEYLDN